MIVIILEALLKLENLKIFISSKIQVCCNCLKNLILVTQVFQTFFFYQFILNCFFLLNLRQQFRSQLIYFRNTSIYYLFLYFFFKYLLFFHYFHSQNFIGFIIKSFNFSTFLLKDINLIVISIIITLYFIIMFKDDQLMDVFFKIKIINFHFIKLFNRFKSQFNIYLN